MHVMGQGGKAVGAVYFALSLVFLLALLFEQSDARAASIQDRPMDTHVPALPLPVQLEIANQHCHSRHCM